MGRVSWCILQVIADGCGEGFDENSDVIRASDVPLRDHFRLGTLGLTAEVKAKGLNPVLGPCHTQSRSLVEPPR